MGKVAEGKCFCCKVETISKANFECGHVQSEHEGGDVTIDNLRPICSLCNKSMGTRNMTEFMQEFGMYNKKPVKKKSPKTRKNINTCSKEDLVAIKGIGKKTAETIIQGRPYKSYVKIGKIKGIGKNTLDEIKKVMCVRKS